MLIPAGSAFVIGAALGLRYRIGALGPAAAILLFCDVFYGVVHGSGAWSILLCCGLTLTSVEFGYLFASATQCLLRGNRASEADRKAGGTEALPKAVPRLKPCWDEEGLPKTASAVLYMQMIRRIAARPPALSGASDAPAPRLRP